ncbi:MAG: hypothetical protein GY832_30935 [Chloroflexi bacterium]|nr:hypothetical protein [Chloroflexota bacterium]
MSNKYQTTCDNTHMWYALDSTDEKSARKEARKFFDGDSTTKIRVLHPETDTYHARWENLGKA